MLYDYSYSYQYITEVLNLLYTDLCIKLALCERFAIKNNKKYLLFKIKIFVENELFSFNREYHIK